MSGNTRTSSLKDGLKRRPCALRLTGPAEREKGSRVLSTRGRSVSMCTSGSGGVLRWLCSVFNSTASASGPEAAAHRRYRTAHGYCHQPQSVTTRELERGTTQHV